MTDIIKEDPPQARRSRKPSGHHLAIADKLMADPGNWYRVADEVKQPGMAGGIKKGTLPAYQPAGAFEAVSRKQGDGWDIYARYVGEEG